MLFGVRVCGMDFNELRCETYGKGDSLPTKGVEIAHLSLVKVGKLYGPKLFELVSGFKVDGNFHNGFIDGGELVEQGNMTRRCLSFTVLQMHAYLYVNLMQERTYYMIYTPSDPLLFVAVKDQNGILKIADDELLEDPAITSAIDEETEFNALAEEEVALVDALLGKR
ncbi:hypothetical protein VNO78_17016 [Psophocarpus tetragonolobus]|uniref:Uncharacterized protein n=1 Tax=Psophocarpus tetragonolobus TaxID=3891 RepID=A0AAN9SJ17_PSOTE